ncbi:hypothetical protein DFJ73DRAFT_778278 [Zopfochytrium polystomum]|nr:hypothetical protein DFJ73DRAFT_778278 [Zopfochytrium polystomum]
MSAGTSASSELAANSFANTDRLALVRDRGGNAGRRFLTASLRRAVFLASCRGDVEVLRWWVGGGGEEEADVEDAVELRGPLEERMGLFAQSFGLFAHSLLLTRSRSASTSMQTAASALSRAAATASI